MTNTQENLVLILESIMNSIIIYRTNPTRVGDWKTTARELAYDFELERRAESRLVRRPKSSDTSREVFLEASVAAVSHPTRYLFLEPLEGNPLQNHTN
jgi:hypothetical protein